jgi:alkylation response protein AidB-like acyl-CoA dehydrogenase
MPASTPDRNPLIRDRDVAFLLYEVFDAERLCGLPPFADHSRDTFDAVLTSARRLARDHLYPAYAAMDREPPVLRDGQVHVHPRMRELYGRMVDLGLIGASRPESVGGQSLPRIVTSMASSYLMAANAAAYGYVLLTAGAAHLLEAFGSAQQKDAFMRRMYAGAWTGTMALTEPQAGSSLADVQSTATPSADGHYLIRASKIFISGGDHDLCENIVHLLLARIQGAPPGTRGISLFAVPKRRWQDGALVPNDVHAAGLIHKIGWRGLPSMVMSYGEAGDCHGWLVGEAHRGLGHMFQMMNDARIQVGLHGVATASVAYHESLAYAQTRAQGRPVAAPRGNDPLQPPVPIIAHADVRRMLLRQKAIVEGGLALLARTSLYADLAEHAPAEEQRRAARLLLDLLTPVAKSFPAEKGFESNALAVQIFGGYGYSSEYPVESWLRDQKLNSIHEGTTGIQGLDLLGRRIVAEGGAALRALRQAIGETVARAQKSQVQASWIETLQRSLATTEALIGALGARGLGGDADGMMRHSAHVLDLVSTLVVGWQWLELAAAAREARTPGDHGFYEGKLGAAQYWFATEMPRIEQLAALCRDGDDSYARMEPGWF